MGEPPRIIELVEIVDGVTASLVRDPLALPSITRLRQRHEYTYMHSVAVCGWMIALAQELQMEPEQIRDAGLAGLLHDVGKATLPPELLEKSNRLTAGEAAMLCEHPARGHVVLRDVPDMPAAVLDVVMSSSRAARRGRLSRRPLRAMHSAVTRGWPQCAISTTRCTCRPARRRKMAPRARRSIICVRRAVNSTSRSCGRSSRVVGAFPPGALVRLRSDRLGVVLDESERDPLHPVVAVFRYVSGMEIPPQRISTKTDPIIGIERPETWHFDDWPALRRKLLALAQ